MEDNRTSAGTFIRLRYKQNFVINLFVIGEVYCTLIFCPWHSPTFEEEKIIGHNFWAVEASALRFIWTFLVTIIFFIHTIILDYVTLNFQTYFELFMVATSILPPVSSVAFWQLLLSHEHAWNVQMIYESFQITLYPNTILT